jgi:hypothetical protein
MGLGLSLMVDLGYRNAPPAEPITLRLFEGGWNGVACSGRRVCGEAVDVRVGVGEVGEWEG